MTAAARLTDVRKTYRTDHLEVAAVRGISLEIEPAAFLSIAGPSGSGKTTLLNLLGALDTPTSGTIAVGDRTTAGLTARELADFRNAHLGFVFQTFNLVPVLTARENVELPLQLRGVADRAERRSRVEAILRDVGLAEMMDRRPNEMSGGQQQRVAIARALVKGPTLVLADEPTANLDHDTAYRILELMKKMRDEQGTTFVFSTHDPKIVNEAEVVLTLEDGRLVNNSGSKSHA
jgi:putative ABC transport system ATP-binding protein